MADREIDEVREDIMSQRECQLLNKQNEESELGVLVVHTVLRTAEQVIHQQRHE